jgi:dTDP-4-amino-4,6-dideoxygalactose transaminase
VDKYTWVDLGDSFLPSELNAAYLWAQLEEAEEMLARRMAAWNRYDAALRPLAEEGLMEVPVIPEGCVHNAHMYYLKCRDLAQRTDFISFMKGRGVQCVFHYIPLHSAPAGLRFGRFHGEDEYTTRESERLVRLPLFDAITPAQQEEVISGVRAFFEGNGK